MSLAELIMFLKSKGTEFEVNQISKEFFAFTAKEKANTIVIDDLGGILKIGKITQGFAPKLLVWRFFRKTSELKHKSMQTQHLAAWSPKCLKLLLEEFFSE